MDDVFDRIDPVRAWAVTATGLIVALIVGSFAFPRRVYNGFIWRYFWGPVVADGTGSACAQRIDGETVLLDGAAECRRAAGVVAESGYTTVSTVSYALVLVFALIGVVFLLQRLGIGDERGFLFALFPFMLFGGALRTVEDASIALLRAGDPAIPFPWSGVLISPLIYFTVFLITLAALLVSVAAARRGIVGRYEPLLAGIGTVALLSTVGYLGWLAVTTDLLTVHPLVPVITLGGATLITAAVWIATQRLAPTINDGTGYMGLVVVWGHSVDGIANVLSLDWADAFGLPTYTSKHVVNRAIVDVTSALQPEPVSNAIGTAWPFLLVKVGAALFVVWVFNEEIFEESPRYSMLLLVAIVAVGLGPGTRDFLRATFGI